MSHNLVFKASETIKIWLWGINDFGVSFSFLFFLFFLCLIKAECGCWCVWRPAGGRQKDEVWKWIAGSKQNKAWMKISYWKPLLSMQIFIVLFKENKNFLPSNKLMLIMWIHVHVCISPKENSLQYHRYLDSPNKRKLCVCVTNYNESTDVCLLFKICAWM